MSSFKVRFFLFLVPVPPYDSFFTAEWFLFTQIYLQGSLRCFPLTSSFVEKFSFSWDILNEMFNDITFEHQISHFLFTYLLKFALFDFYHIIQDSIEWLSLLAANLKNSIVLAHFHAYLLLVLVLAEALAYHSSRR